MNEHILKVMAWLKAKDFYSQEVMEENYIAAYAAAAYAAAAAAYAAAYAAAAYATAAAYAADNSAHAAYHVFQFFKHSGHKRSQYEKEVNKRLNNENRTETDELESD